MFKNIRSQYVKIVAIFLTLNRKPGPENVYNYINMRKKLHQPDMERHCIGHTAVSGNP
jgi:hypothetical protein